MNENYKLEENMSMFTMYVLTSINKYKHVMFILVNRS